MVACRYEESTMRTLTSWMLAALVAAMAATGSVGAMAAGGGAPAAHAHDEAMPTKLTLNKGKKWGTDAPLRTGMKRIRDLTAEGVEQAHAGRLDAKAAAVLATNVEKEVAGIVANCKLEPKADAMLHLVIADLGAGTDALAGKTAGSKPEQGLLQVAKAVNDYGRHFDHPGYRPVNVGH
jgi:hypothetical protein